MYLLNFKSDIFYRTYDKLSFVPCPNLNVIIGPNGSGKSSIICGICLALGGNPKILGRSERIADYIKHGAESGVRIKAVLKKQKGIVDNPCNFLAQDKVRSFAEQNPQVLLENTEKVSLLVNSLDNQLDNSLNDWLLPLESITEKIDACYSCLFEKLGCEGRVHLQKPEDKYDIDSYGVIISAKFRKNEHLRQLTHQVQSGGERSVSTMLYLMSLQQMSVVPFRCVDEINQGMDPANERRVFDMIVNLLSNEENLAKTQYFL
ncbi:unnamed protein product [Dracunculus medinensis]|uniref:Structural maintenance of chromosomes protein 5 n=1 Tax=Dracunculus medinensis TaxID=318479 RepID=A0A3P7PQI6_DRAME|nr:unnamed protein product [Dracunculus medinensis]